MQDWVKIEVKVVALYKESRCFVNCGCDESLFEKRTGEGCLYQFQFSINDDMLFWCNFRSRKYTFGETKT